MSIEFDKYLDIHLFCSFFRRNCYFDDERRLEYFNEYSLENCLFECRLTEKIRTFNCTSISFWNTNNDNPDCSIGFNFIFSLDGMADILNSYNCTCLPSCSSTTYEVTKSVGTNLLPLFDNSSYSADDVLKNHIVLTLDRKINRRIRRQIKNGPIFVIAGMICLCFGISFIGAAQTAYYFFFFWIKQYIERKIILRKNPIIMDVAQPFYAINGKIYVIKKPKMHWFYCWFNFFWINLRKYCTWCSTKAPATTKSSCFFLPAFRSLLSITSKPSDVWIFNGNLYCWRHFQRSECEKNTVKSEVNRNLIQPIFTNLIPNCSIR